MKELSTEEKARRYDDLLVKLQEAKVDNDVCDERYCCVIDDIVPELAESNDEKIRKALVELISTFLRGHENGKIHGVYAKDILAWLEKQGEHAKFRDSIQGGYYHCDHNHGAFFPIEEQGNWELVEQNPAWSEEDEKILSNIIKDLVHPWNEYIPDRIEDEIKWLKNKLKSLKDRVQPQPKQEWDGGDEAHLHSLITHLEQWIERHPNTTGADIQGENITWLKSLRPQNTWKPSEEQIEALEGIISCVGDNQSWEISTEYLGVLLKLKEQLKKLI